MARVAKVEKLKIAVDVARLSALIASRVYDAMNSKNINEKEVARRLGVSTNYLQKLLDGDILLTLPMMVRLANVFGFHWHFTICNGYPKPICIPANKGGAR